MFFKIVNINSEIPATYPHDGESDDDDADHAVTKVQQKCDICVTKSVMVMLGCCATPCHAMSCDTAMPSYDMP